MLQILNKVLKEVISGIALFIFGIAFLIAYGGSVC